MKARIGTFLDYFGIVLSWACMLHCVLLPFVIPVLPALEVFADDHTHRYLAIVILLVGALAFHRGYQKHQNTMILLLGLSGIALLFVALTIPVDSALPIDGNVHHGHTHTETGHQGHGGFFFSAETLLTVLGSILLVYAHLRNIRLARRSCCGGRHGERSCPIEESHVDSSVTPEKSPEKSRAKSAAKPQPGTVKHLNNLAL